MYTLYENNINDIWSNARNPGGEVLNPPCIETITKPESNNSFIHEKLLQQFDTLLLFQDSQTWVQWYMIHNG